MIAVATKEEQIQFKSLPINLRWGLKFFVDEEEEPELLLSIEEIGKMEDLDAEIQVSICFVLFIS